MSENVSLDYRIITDIVEQGSRVLDLGCGNGDLLYLLAKERSALVQGIEISEEAVYQCVEKGLSVFHSDIDSGLTDYPDKSFDYVILNQSLQEVKKIDLVMDETLRVGNKAIIGFSNFAHIRARLMMFFRGKAPITKSLPYHWFDTPNVRFLSISDFKYYCAVKGFKILHVRYLGKKREVGFWPNLFALNAIFVIQK
ncbi:MAG: methionine biosynthesis protein MetW [Candidatus Omnitrophica bacterium]|nr:methionine biosynthesis protein MetW [Candidatus Omnitrophota bacterium]